MSTNRIRRAMLFAMTFYALSSTLTTAAEKTPDTSAATPDIVLNEHQSKQWFAALEVCGAIDSDECLQAFRALLTPAQRQLFDRKSRHSREQTDLSGGDRE